VMPGGVRAIREPWRMAVAWASAAGCEADVVAQRVPDAQSRAVAGLVAAKRGPVTTSMGRLFDAVAVLLGGRMRVSYEAQAAIELEAMARTVARADAPGYSGAVTVTENAGDTVLDPTALVAAIVADRRRGVPAPVLAAGFHEAIGRSAATLALSLATARELDTIVLTGGVFQNARLSEIVEDDLRAAGATVLVPEAIPPNDGGISIGQAAIAAMA
jgi:hydrogenase maturation protein HypF